MCLLLLSSCFMGWVVPSRTCVISPLASRIFTLLPFINKPGDRLKLQPLSKWMNRQIPAMIREFRLGTSKQAAKIPLLTQRQKWALMQRSWGAGDAGAPATLLLPPWLLQWPSQHSPAALGTASPQLSCAALTQLSLCSCAGLFQLAIFLLWPVLPFPLIPLRLPCSSPSSWQLSAPGCPLCPRSSAAPAGHTRRSFQGPHMPRTTLLLCSLLILHTLRVYYGNLDQKEPAFCQSEVLGNKRKE